MIIAEKIKTCNKQKFVIAYIQNYLLVFSAQRVIVDLRLEIQKHLMWLPLRFFAESKVGELVSRVTNDVTVIQGVITEAPVSFLRQVVKSFTEDGTHPELLARAGLYHCLWSLQFAE